MPRQTNDFCFGRRFVSDREASTFIDVTILGLTLTGGDAASAIFFPGAGNLTVTATTITGNSRNGINSRGYLTVTASRISGNGRDGINSIADLAVSGSTIINNYVGIRSYGPNSTISATTISGNSVSGLRNGGYLSRSLAVPVSTETHIALFVGRHKADAIEALHGIY